MRVLVPGIATMPQKDFLGQFVNNPPEAGTKLSIVQMSKQN